MKLKLPKLLLSAVLLLGSMSQAATLSSNVYEYYGNSLTVSGTVNLNSDYEYAWSPSGGDANLTGNGTIACKQFDYQTDLYIGETSGTVNIGSGITMSYAGFYLEYGNFNVDATFKNYSYIDSSDATIDITDAKIETCLLAGEGTTFIRPNLEVNNNVCLEASGELTIQGNLVLNGGRKPISGNVFQYMMNANEAKKYFGGVDYIVWENVPTISITGTLTLKADTAVTFWNDDETGGYYIPSSGEALFICGKLENQASLNKLKPYAVKMEITDYEEYEGEIYPIGDYTQIKFLSDYEFEACTGEGGLTYIYLVSGSSTAPSGSGSAGGSAPAPAPGLNVSSGQTVEISQKPDSFVNMWLIATGWGIC